MKDLVSILLRELSTNTNKYIRLNLFASKFTFKMKGWTLHFGPSLTDKSTNRRVFVSINLFRQK